MARKEDGTIYFDEEEQKVFDKALQDRLSRHKPDDYDDLAEIAKDLEDFGYSGTPAEKKAAVKAYKEQVRLQKEQQEEIDRLQKMEDEEGLTPAQAKRFKDLEDKLEKSTKAIEEITGKEKAKTEAEKSKIEQEENWKKQVADFNEAHADTDLTALEADEDFIEYATGRAGTLTTLYEGYVKFTSKLEKKTADEIRAKYKSKELLSTGTGKGSKSETGDYGLTENQKSLAKSNGMSYKEYADLLEHA